MLSALMLIGAAYPAIASVSATVPQATVSRDGSRWQIDFTLPANKAAWVFPVSAPTLDGHRQWRSGTWRVTTPGVRIDRHGGYDLLTAANGRLVPRQVSIIFTPSDATLDREYDPAIVFSNGSVALYSDQFDLAPVDVPRAIDSREAGLSVEDFGGRHAAVRFHDAAGPVFVAGRRTADPVLSGAGTYVVFGAGTVEEVGGVAMLTDPALPAWLGRDIAGFVPEVASTYADRLGKRNDPRLPLLLLSWRGATPGKVVNDGGVRPGEIFLKFEGAGLLDRNERAAQRTRWFIAHEMAHFWLGSEGVAYRTPGDAWITEGGAEMMAFTLLAASDRHEALAELQRAVDDCIKHAAKPLAGAGERHESRAFYACGTVFALAATGAIRQHGGYDFFDFLRPLLEAHRSDRVLGHDDWLRHFAMVAHSDVPAKAMRTLMESGVAEPASAIEAMLRSTGVPVTRHGDTVILAPAAI